MEQSGFVVITGIFIKKNIPEHHILPRIQDSIEQFGGNQYFTLSWNKARQITNPIWFQKAKSALLS